MGKRGRGGKKGEEDVSTSMDTALELMEGKEEKSLILIHLSLQRGGEGGGEESTLSSSQGNQVGLLKEREGESFF